MPHEWEIELECWEHHMDGPEDSGDEHVFENDSVPVDIAQRELADMLVHLKRTAVLNAKQTCVLCLGFSCWIKRSG